MSKFTTLKTQVNKSQLNRLVDIVTDFNKISNIHKIKFIADKVLIYTISCDENKKNVINVVKCVIYDKIELFPQVPTEFESEFIIPDGKMFAQKIKFLADKKKDDSEQTIMYEFKYTEDMIASFKGQNDFLTVTAITAEAKEIFDLNIDQIKAKMNVDLACGSFNAYTEHMTMMLRYITMDKDNRLLDLDLEDGKAVFSEKEWSLITDKTVDTKINRTFRFDKTYLKYIPKDMETVTFHLFDSFIVIKDEHTYLMINIELES